MQSPKPNAPSLTETCRFLSDPELDGRHPGSDGHRIARDYLQQRFEQLRFDPLFNGSWFQRVEDGTTKPGENLAGIKPGQGDRVILLGAHYDHFKGVPGADDNAAALSILIETCRLLGVWEGQHSLVLCFFDQEEPPYFHTPRMGSTFFVENSPLDLGKLDCAIILDLCGHDVSIPGHEDAVFILGAEYSSDLVEAVQAVDQPGISTYLFRNDRVGDMSDHHAFRLNGNPFLFFSCGRWEHYHQPTDTFERLNLTKMQRFAEHLVQLVRELDDRSVCMQPVEGFERIEMESLARLMGPQALGNLDRTLAELMWRFKL